jgi:hypothetical protein
MLSAPSRNLFFALVIGVGFLSTPHEARAAGDDALGVLKAMSDYLASQKTISSNFDSALEVMTPQGEKIQFNSSGAILMQRPNELRATRIGGYADVELLLDGKTATLFGKNLNIYGQMDGISSIDQLIDIVACPCLELIFFSGMFTIRSAVTLSRLSMSAEGL